MVLHFLCNTSKSWMLFYGCFWLLFLVAIAFIATLLVLFRLKYCDLVWRQPSSSSPSSKSIHSFNIRFRQVFRGKCTFPKFLIEQSFQKHNCQQMLVCIIIQMHLSLWMQLWQVIFHFLLHQDHTCRQMFLKNYFYLLKLDYFEWI